MEYLGSDEVPNHEGQREHQHLHSIACHFGILLAINVNVVEVDRVISRQCYHGGISHHSFKALRQPAEVISALPLLLMRSGRRRT